MKKPAMANKNASRIIRFMFDSPLRASLQPIEMREQKINTYKSEGRPSPDHQIGLPSQQFDHVALASPRNEKSRLMAALHKHNRRMEIEAFGFHGVPLRFC